MHYVTGLLRLVGPSTGASSLCESGRLEESMHRTLNFSPTASFYN